MIASFAWLCVFPPSLALLYFSLEVLLGLRSVASLPSGEPDLDVAVVIPAHDEAAQIAGTVERLRERLLPATRIVVIADNCSDGETATLARSAGAEVIERNDPSQRGKGFALDFAREFLASAPPQAVFVLDADCRLERGSVEAAAGRAVARDEPVQAVNLLHAAPAASPLVQLSNFAMLIKNLVRARGLHRLGGGIPLFGTGMAFPWAIFSRLELATSDAVEDLRLSLILALRGVRVYLDEETRVTSPAAPLEDSLGQRRRWEHGFLLNAMRHAIPLLIKGIARRSRHLGALGAHMLVPPLALLFLVAGVAAMPALAAALVSGAPGPLAFLSLSFLAAVTATGLAWRREGRSTLSLAALARAPLYVLWKIPLYIGFVTSRQREWNRTRRVNEKT
jgi:cellulose synthase/poly-beta-1,6-N-acetylglucosamine synthase-like glycosyltransferase